MNVRQMTNTELKQKAEAFGQTLYQCAKKQPERKFHALYDKIYRPDILKTAWLMVKGNKGSAGVDGITIEYIENKVTEREFLNTLYTKLKEERYGPQPVKRVYIPKGNGESRPLGIPTIEDRVVQQATRLVVEPIFEADFKECSYGFRPSRNAHQAVTAIQKSSRNTFWVVDVDIKGYFDHINHEKLMKLVELRISDGRLLKLIRSWLKVGVLIDSVTEKTEMGSPQGGVISPLLANIYLNYLDTLWEKKFREIGTLIRYADDMVIMTRTKKQSNQAIEILKAVFQRLELEMNQEKSRLVNMWNNIAGFDFLGFHHRKMCFRTQTGAVYYVLKSIPSKKAMKKMRKKIKEYLSPRNKLWLETSDLIEGLNRKIIGIRNYYYLDGFSSKWLYRIDSYISDLLIAHNNKRRGKRTRHPDGVRNVREIIKNSGLKKLA